MIKYQCAASHLWPNFYTLIDVAVANCDHPCENARRADESISACMDTCTHLHTHQWLFIVKYCAENISGRSTTFHAVEV